MKPLLRSLDELLALHNEEQTILLDLDGPPDESELDALTDIRADILTTAVTVVGEVEAIERGGVRTVAACLHRIYQSDHEEFGFSRVPAVLELRNEVAANSWRPRAVVAPPDFPLLPMCEWIMRDSSPRPFEQLDASDASFFERLIVREPGVSPLPERLLVVRFLKLDWGLQRALCDIARRERTDLLIAVTAEPRGHEYASIADYVLDLEIGVHDRLFFSCVSKATRMWACASTWDEEVVAAWLRDPEFWRNMLFPIRELRDALATAA